MVRGEGRDKGTQEADDGFERFSLFASHSRQTCNAPAEPWVFAHLSKHDQACNRHCFRNGERPNHEIGVRNVAVRAALHLRGQAKQHTTIPVIKRSNVTVAKHHPLDKPSASRSWWFGVVDRFGSAHNRRRLGGGELDNNPLVTAAGSEAPWNLHPTVGGAL